MKLLALAIACLLLGTSALAATPAPYSAAETVRRAEIGSYSPRLRPAVRVTVTGARTAPATFDRLTCRENPAEPRTLICEPRSRP